MYLKFGLVEPVPGLTDEGRFAPTKAEANRFVIRVPSQRNVARTGPGSTTGARRRSTPRWWRWPATSSGES